MNEYGLQGATGSQPERRYRVDTTQTGWRLPGEVSGIVVAKINAMQLAKTAPAGFRECPRAQRFASDDKANGDNAVGQTRAPWSSSSGPGNG
jgi:hypothetical protein